MSDDLFSHLARIDDPETSQDAATAITAREGGDFTIKAGSDRHAALREYEVALSLTDDEAAFHALRRAGADASMARSEALRRRCGDLRAWGLITVTGRRVSGLDAGGRPRSACSITPLGQRVLDGLMFRQSIVVDGDQLVAGYV